MKAIAINGSPRKGWNTEALLKEALRGGLLYGRGNKTRTAIRFELHRM